MRKSRSYYASQGARLSAGIFQRSRSYSGPVDGLRGSATLAPPEMRPIERSPTFNTVNRGKRGLTLDLQRAEGVDILRKLATEADVIFENFSVGVMAKLGLTHDELARKSPRLITVSLPALGAAGPEAAYRGYGVTIE